MLTCTTTRMVLSTESRTGFLLLEKSFRGESLSGIFSIPRLGAQSFQANGTFSLRFLMSRDLHGRTATGVFLRSCPECAFRQVPRPRRTFRWITIHGTTCFEAPASLGTRIGGSLPAAFHTFLPRAARSRCPVTNC